MYYKTKLVQIIWAGAKGDYLMIKAPINAIAQTTPILVKENWTYFLMQSNRPLPCLTADKVEVKLSSRRIIPAASLAIFVPWMPIANPTSAVFRAGGSPAPSPVKATTFLSCLSPVAKRYLSWGEALKSTLSSSAIYLNLLKFPTTSFVFLLL